jgi:hypothetical protein
VQRGALAAADVLDVTQEPCARVTERGGEMVVGALADLATLLGEEVGQAVLGLAAGEVSGGWLAAGEVRRRQPLGGLFGGAAGDAGLGVPDGSFAALDQLQVTGDALGASFRRAHGSLNPLWVRPGCDLQSRLGRCCRSPGL